MRRFSSFALFVLALVASPLLAQSSPSADEQAIRALVARSDAGEELARTSDSIFWSGAYSRPQVRGGEKVAPTKASHMDERQSQTRKTTVRRIVVSDSGDLAYEFSEFQMALAMKDGAKREFDGSVLRVWEKQDGQWKIAAWFARPHSTD